MSERSSPPTIETSAFEPNELSAALDHLRVPDQPHEREHLRRRLLALRVRVLAATREGIATELASSELGTVEALLARSQASLRKEVQRRSGPPPADR